MSKSKMAKRSKKSPQIPALVADLADRLTSRAHAASVAEVSVSQLQRYISGKSEPSAEVLARLAKAAGLGGISLDDLVSGSSLVVPPPKKEVFFTLDCEDANDWERECENTVWLVSELRNFQIRPIVFISAEAIEKYPGDAVSFLTENTDLAYHGKIHSCHAPFFAMLDAPKLSIAKELAVAYETYWSPRLKAFKDITKGKYVPAVRLPGFAWHPGYYEALRHFGFHISFDLYPHGAEPLPSLFRVAGFTFVTPDWIQWLDDERFAGPNFLGDLEEKKATFINFAVHPNLLYRDLSPEGELKPLKQGDERIEQKKRNLLGRVQAVMKWAEKSRLSVNHDHDRFRTTLSYKPTAAQRAQMVVNMTFWVRKELGFAPGFAPQYLPQLLEEFFSLPETGRESIVLHE